ncbi:MAG TPA: hypothetical protein VJY62_00260 [Bacteroidia bacterium]|nr:hypothetical protein [Bacteroidia bacterium]
MRSFITCMIFLFCCSLTFGQYRRAYKKWVKESQTDIRMIPMYGHRQNTKEQFRDEEKFLKTVLEQEGTKRAGSEHLIKLGFNYLHQNKLKTAMTRFNQAWSLDSTNTNVFWGFGGVYFRLHAYNEALRMYKLGMKVDSVNANLITGMGAVYLSMYSENPAKKENLASAVSYLEKSYQLDSKNSSTVYKLIMGSLYSGDCEKAKKYFAECEKLEKNPVREEFRTQFKEQCK